MKISAEIVADSQAIELLDQPRITSMLVTFPRFILAELNTHRVFSRNSASSRAIPFKRMVQMVNDNPFVPIAWQKEHTGMQGTEYFTEQDDIDRRIDMWTSASVAAVEHAQELNELKVTKQFCNRILEPFMWHTALITSTEWENFFELRCPQYLHEYDSSKFFRSKKDYKKFSIQKHQEQGKVYSQKDIDRNLQLDEGTGSLAWLSINKGAAEIHMMALAEAMWDAMNESTPKPLKGGEWHIPYGNRIIDEQVHDVMSTADVHKSDTLWDVMQPYMVKISTAMAARTSYTVVGDEKEVKYENLIALHDRIVTANPVHASPTEHAAECMTLEEFDANIIIENGTCIYGVSRNFRGFKQYRQILGI